MTILSIPPLAMSVVALYVCAYHLLLFLRRPRRRLDLTFALTCLAVGLYDICCVGNYNSSTPAVGVQWQRMQLMTLSLVTAAFLWFVVSYTSMKPGRRRIPVYLFSLFFLSAAVVQAVCPPGPGGFTWTDQESVKNFIIPFVGWPVAYNEMSHGPFTDFHAFSFLVAYLYAFWVTLHFYWKVNPRKAAPLLLAILIFFASVIEDVMVSSGFYDFIYTIEYGFIGMLLVMAYALSTELVDAVRTKRALTESEQSYRTIAEDTPVLLCSFLPGGEINYVNRAYCNYFDKTPEQLIGKTFLTPIPETDRNEVITHISALEIDSPTQTLEHRVIAPNDELRWQRWTNRAIFDDRGKVISYQSVGEDITERKRADKALRKERNFAENLLNTAQAIILVLDVEGRIVRFNRYMEEISGYSLAEVQGKDWFSTFLPTSDHMKIKELFKSAVADIQTRGNVNSIVTRDGSKRDIEWYDKTMKDDDGNVVGVLAVGLDITKRKQAEQERQRLEEQLRHAQKMEAVGQLAGGIAHDFNNILTAILGNAELLKMGLPAEGKQATFTDEVIKGAVRAADLTKQLLAFARKGKWRIAPVDIHDVVTQTVNMLTHSIDRRIDIRLELHASPSTIMGDPTQLHSALLNLGVNARDAMPDGGALTYTTRNVTLTKSDCDEHPYELAPGGFLEVSITDTGAGMDEQTQKRIFEPFFTTKEMGKGTGLGLAGVYGCVRSHDGSVSVSSKPGQGATFTILLPLADANVAAPARIAANEAPAKGTGRVLIVDDEESVRDLVRTSLQNLGYTVSTCDDGIAGVDYYREHHREIDLVILDLIMPRMNGQDAFREMKKINPHVRVLVSSGFSQTQATRQMLDEGALGLLNKPFQVTELAREVAEHIHHDSR